MDPIEQLALAGQALVRAALAGARRGIAAPWLFDFGLHAGAVLLVWNFAHPAVSSFVAPALRELAGASALHYPSNLLAIPAVLARADRLAGPVLLPVVTAWSAALFAGGYGKTSPRPMAVLLDTLGRVPRVLVVGIPLAIAHGAAMDAGLAAIAGLGRRPLAGLASGFGATLAEIVVLAVGALVLPLVALDPARLAGLGGRLRAAWRLSGGAAIGVACVMALLGLASRLVCSRWELGAADSRPDVIPLLGLAGAVAGSAGGLVFCGASTIIHISLVREEA